jgi:hypothetical protein
MLERTLSRDSETERLIHSGHGLAALLHRGPLHGDVLGPKRDLVEQLLVDIVARWEPRAAR